MNFIKSTRTFFSNSARAVQELKGDSNITGNAGAIREAGGAFGKLGAAKEAQYFYKQQSEQLRELSKKRATSKKFQKAEVEQK